MKILIKICSFIDRFAYVQRNSKVADPPMLDVHAIYGHMRKHAEYGNHQNYNTHIHTNIEHPN